MTSQAFRGRRRRLEPDAYRGEAAVAFTLCIAGRTPVFTEDGLVRSLVTALGQECAAHGCVVPVYCFMPDHVHVLTQGKTATADGWRAIVRFKQRSGYQLARRSPAVRWQPSFHDHVLRSQEDVAAHARYVADNPVRAGLVSSWEAYPFVGAIGIGLEDMLWSLATRGR